MIELHASKRKGVWGGSPYYEVPTWGASYDKKWKVDTCRLFEWGKTGSVENLYGSLLCSRVFMLNVLNTWLRRFCVPYEFFGNKRTTRMVVVFVGLSVRCYYRLNRGIWCIVWPEHSLKAVEQSDVAPSLPIIQPSLHKTINKLAQVCR